MAGRQEGLHHVNVSLEIAMRRDEAHHYIAFDMRSTADKCLRNDERLCGSGTTCHGRAWNIIARYATSSKTRSPTFTTSLFRATPTRHCGYMNSSSSLDDQDDPLP